MTYLHRTHRRRRNQFSLRLNCSPLLSFIVLLCCQNSLSAMPLADYHKNLQHAITALDTLVEADEDESSDDYQKRLAETLIAIRTTLPKHQAVESGEEICNVDNSWLHQQLEEFEKATDSERSAVGAQILERIKAIDERITELEGAGTIATSKAEANEKLAAILSRPEYAKKDSEVSAIARLWQELVKWVMSLLPKRAPLEPGSASLFSKFAQIFVVGIALAVIVYVLRMFVPRLMRSREKRVKGKAQPRIVLGERLEPDQSAVDLLADAEALARRGDVRAAIRKAYIALLVELGERKIISLAQHKTNRDYLRSVRDEPSLHSKMIGLTDSFERHWYGLVQATQNDWQNFRAGYNSALQE
jgi:hypothetical protein